jgi:hypothetical protein
VLSFIILALAAYIFSVLIYGSENWKTTKQEKKKQYTFQNRSLGQILRM